MTAPKSPRSSNSESMRGKTHSRTTGGARARKEHPIDLYLGTLATGSRRTMDQILRSIAKHLSGDPKLAARKYPWHKVEYPDSLEVRAHFLECYSPSTARKAVAALRGVLRACWRMKIMPTERYSRAVDIPGVRGTRQAAGRAVDPDDLEAVLDVCFEDQTPSGIRDAALIAVLYGAGLRRREAGSLTVASVDLRRGSITVVGKGNKQRTVPIGPNNVETLSAWLDERGREPGPLFVACDSAGRLVDRPLGEATMWSVLKRRSTAAGVPNIAPHDLRRTCATNLLDAGEDLATVQRFLGHADLTTTALYDRRGDQVLRRAAGKVDGTRRSRDRPHHQRRRARWAGAARGRERAVRRDLTALLGTA